MEDDRIGQPSLSSVQRSLRYHWFFTIGNVGVTLFLVVFIVLKPEVVAFNSAGNPAVPPLTLNYQGRLVDGNGVAVTGAVPLQFEIFDSLEGGTSEWGPELHPAVVVQNGLFQVSLGSVSGGIPLDIWENSLYLEVQVGEDILAPRELIQPAATAGVAFTVPDGAITTSKLAPDAFPSNLGHVAESEIITVTALNQVFISTNTLITVSQPSYILITAKGSAITAGTGGYYAGICHNGTLIGNTHHLTNDVALAPEFEKFAWTTIHIVEAGTHTYNICVQNSSSPTNATLQWYRPVISLIAFPTE